MNQPAARLAAFPKEAMILAAGHGDRLRPLTQIYPKPLLPIANVPMIERLIWQLKEYGVEKCVINLFHLGELLSDYLGDGARFGLRIIYSREPQLLGTGGGIANMLQHIEGTDFLCLNGDTILLADLRRAWRLHSQNQSKATMVLTPKRSESREGIISVADVKSGRPHSLVGILGLAVDSLPKHQECNFTGSHFFKRDFLQTFFRTHAVKCIIREGYLLWLKDHAPLYGYVEDLPLLDTGTIERYLEANAYVLRHVEEHTRPKKKGIRTVSPVALAEDIQFGAGVVIGPNVSIASDCRIGANTRLRNCILLPGSSTAAHQQIENMVLYT